MSKDLLSKLLAGMAAALVAGISHGGAIATRADLVGLLGGQGTLETFEAFNISAGSAAILTCGVLHSAAICNSQTNLVVPGIEFTFGTLLGTGQDPASGQWDGAGYSGAPSRELLSQGQPLTLNFLQPVQAFGIDLRAFSPDPSSGATFGAIAQLKLFGPDDTKLIEVIASVDLSDSGTPVFVGWSDAGGIGRVEFQQAVQGNRGGWSPIIDNLEFGSRVLPPQQVPEPSPLALLALGLAGLLVRHLSKRARP